MIGMYLAKANLSGKVEKNGKGMALKRDIQDMPDWVETALQKAALFSAYQARPPYQRNDYLGWINRAVRPATQQKRLNQMLAELRSGDVYMGMAWRGGQGASD